MNPHRPTILAATALSIAAWAYACGDGAVEPDPQPSEPLRPTTVTVTPATVTLTAIGATTQLAVEVRDQNGRAMTETEWVSRWTSSDSSTAYVDASGLVTAVGNGQVRVTATVTLTSRFMRGTAAVTVAQEVNAVTMSPPADTLLVADTVRLSAGVVDANGHAVADPEVAFAWASGDTLVAVVDQDGLVTGVSEGEAEITAASAGLTGRARLTVVVLGRPATIVVSAAADTITPGETVRLEAEALDAHGFAVADAEFTWASSDLSVARVGASGLVTAVALGRATVTAAAEEARGTSEITVVTVAARERADLVALYHATDGPNWVNSENWLTDAPLDQWYGVTTNAEGRVVELRLDWNGLSGSIPGELGRLDALRVLHLYGNRLAGPIPPELGNLVHVYRLALHDNDLSGPIPPELGDLVNLDHLGLSGNNLSGSIPPELGNLVGLSWLLLHNNDFSGPVPAWLGNLTLYTLTLSYNNLTGSIPPELGNLPGLSKLALTSNDLSGPVPPEFGSMSGLRKLYLSNNPRLSGPLPASMVDIPLEELVADGTNLCVPSEPSFQSWLRAISSRIITCGSKPAMAYLTQAVQSREYPVPLVAGEKALLRVFVTATQSTTVGIPAVRTRFYLNGAESHVVDIPAKTTPIPTAVLENNLNTSANAEIPGEVVQPGLEMVIEVDPDEALDADLVVAKRIPETGRSAVEVHKMPVFAYTIVPFLWRSDPDSAIIEIAKGMAADPQGHELLWGARELLPIDALDVTAHPPVLTSTNNTWLLADEMDAIRALEGEYVYYVGMMSGTTTGPSYAGWGVAFTHAHPYVIAHELGHTLRLSHAPCGTPNVLDEAYPYPDGSTGAWGYDFRSGGALMDPRRNKDLMSYCGPPWISDYHFTKALNYRLINPRAPLAPHLFASRAGASTESLLLWGGTDAEGNPFLNPAFVADAPAALPERAGDYALTGSDADGSELFSLNFAMPEMAHGDGRSSFAFTVPVQSHWAGALSSITLTGPDGSATVDGESDRPMAILRDPSTGRVRGFLSDLPPATQAAMDAAGRAAGPEMEVLFSRGIPDAEAWRR